MIRTPPRGPALAGLALIFLSFSPTSQAGSVSSVGLPIDLATLGSENLMTLLTVQASPTESGAVSWNGAVDVRSGNALPQSFTRTVADLRGLGINGRSFGIVFSGNEAAGGLSVTLPKFSLQFFAADGTPLFSATYQAAAGKAGVPSFGGSSESGWLYRVSLTGAEADLFYASDANRIGVLIDRTNPVGSTSGGPEILSLLQFEIMCCCDSQTPEPASILVWLVGTVGIWTARRARKTPETAKS
jgi:hypothetical protein